MYLSYSFSIKGLNDNTKLKTAFEDKGNLNRSEKDAMK